MTAFRRKINFLASLALLLATVSCGGERPTISGNLVSLDDGYLWLCTYDGAFNKIDSTLSHGGRFAFEQPDILPGIVFVNPQSLPDLYIPVLVEGRDVYISGNLNYRDDIRVSGTESNDLLRAYIRSIRDYDIMAQTIGLEIGQLQASGDPADSSKYKRLVSKRDNLRKRMAESRAAFVRQHPSSLVSAMFLYLSLNDTMNYRQVDSLIGQLDSTIVDNTFSRRLRMRLDELNN